MSPLLESSSKFYLGRIYLELCTSSVDRGHIELSQKNPCVQRGVDHSRWMPSDRDAMYIIGELEILLSIQDCNHTSLVLLVTTCANTSPVKLREPLIKPAFRTGDIPDGELAATPAVPAECVADNLMSLEDAFP